MSGEPVDPALTRKRGPAAKGRPWHRKWGAQANWCSGKPCRSNLLIGRWIVGGLAKRLPRTRLTSLLSCAGSYPTQPQFTFAVEGSLGKLPRGQVINPSVAPDEALRADGAA